MWRSNCRDVFEKTSGSKNVDKKNIITILVVFRVTLHNIGSRKLNNPIFVKSHRFSVATVLIWSRLGCTRNPFDTFHCARNERIKRINRTPVFECDTTQMWTVVKKKKKSYTCDVGDNIMTCCRRRRRLLIRAFTRSLYCRKRFSRAGEWNFYVFV